MFYERIKTTYLGNRAQYLKCLHEKIIFGPFERCFHEGSLWKGHRALVSFILKKQIFVHFFYHGD